MKKICLLLILLMVAICATASAAKIVYVDKNATGADDGTSETDAWDTIAKGLLDIVATDSMFIKYSAAPYTPGALLSVTVSDVNIKGYNITFDETTLVSDQDDGQPYYKDETFGYVVIDYENGAYDGIASIGNDGVRISNLKLEDLVLAAKAVVFDSTDATQYSGNVLKNCWIDSTLRSIFYGVGFDSQISPQCINNRFEGLYLGAAANHGVITTRSPGLSGGSGMGVSPIIMGNTLIITGATRGLIDLRVPTAGVPVIMDNMIHLYAVATNTPTFLINFDNTNTQGFIVSNNTLYIDDGTNVLEILDGISILSARAGRFYNNIIVKHPDGTLGKYWDIIPGFTDYNAYPDATSGSFTDDNGVNLTGVDPDAVFYSTATEDFRPILESVAFGGKPKTHLKAIDADQPTEMGAYVRSKLDVNVVTVINAVPMSTDDIWDNDISDNVVALSAAVQLNTAKDSTDEIGTAGAGLTNIDLPNQTMDIAGTITTVTNLTNNGDKTGYALSSAGNAAVTDDWEAQSQADPTGFEVNIRQIYDNDVSASSLENQYDGADTLGTTGFYPLHQGQLNITAGVVEADVVAMDNNVITDATMADNVKVDVNTIRTNATSATNIDFQYDGTTGLSGDLFPANQSQIGNIANTGAAINTVASGATITFGSETNDYTATQAFNGTYHIVEPELDTEYKIDFYYEFDIGATGVPVSMTLTGRLFDPAPTSDDIIIQAYDWGITDWVTVSGLDGINSAVDEVKTIILFSTHVGTGNDAGTVRVRFVNVDITSDTDLYVDLLYCSYSIVSSPVGYANGSIWIDTVNGTAGTTTGVNGVADNPVDSLVDALVISGNTGIGRFEVSPKSEFTFASDMDGYTFKGSNYIINFAGYDTDSLLLEGATTKGILTASGSCGMLQCRLFDGASLPSGGYGGCVLPGDLTLTGTFYMFDACVSAVAGTDAPSIDLGVVGAQSINFRHYSGGIEVKNLAADDNMTLEGHGQLILNANCSGGTIAIRGHFDITDNVIGGFLGTISDDARFNTTQIDDTITANSLVTDIPNTAEFEARTIVSADYVIVGDTIAGVTLVTTTTTNTDMVGTDNAATEAKQDIMQTDIDNMQGTTFNTSTDSLEAIRNRGDAAWITGTSDATEAKQDLILEDLVDIKGTGFVKDTHSLKNIWDDTNWVLSFLEGDTWTNTATVPWREEIRLKGTTTPLTERELFQVTGTDVTSTSHPIGRKESP